MALSVGGAMTVAMAVLRSIPSVFRPGQMVDYDGIGYRCGGSNRNRIRLAT